MTAELQIEIHDSLADITPAQWNALSDDGNPFLRHEFLHTLDITGCLGQSTGWYPRYFLLWSGDGDAKELIGAVPAYVKTNSYGEFVFDWAWADAFERHQLEYYPKLVSSIPFTPATGRRILIRNDQPYIPHLKLLATAVRQFSDAEGLSSVHYLFLTQAESEILSSVAPSRKASEQQHAGTPTAAAETSPQQAHTHKHQQNSKDTSPNSSEQSEDEQNNEVTTILTNLDNATDHLRRIDCQYHWHNNHYQDFDDFLSRCTSKRRKTIRRERRHVSDANIRIEQRLGSSLSKQEWQWVHELYESTYDRKWGNPSLTYEFFTHIGELMGNNVLIVLAYDEIDETPLAPIACSIMFIGTKTLYGRYWGCRKIINSLHFEACYYQGIEYCITHGIQQFEPGAQGEHKITRGFVPTITRSAHYIQHPDFRDAIANYLAQETTYVEQRCEGLNDLLPFKADTLLL